MGNRRHIHVAGNVWVGKTHHTFGVTYKRGDCVLTFVYRDVSKVCIPLPCISPLIDFWSQSWYAPMASDVIHRGVREPRMLQIGETKTWQ